MPSRNFLEGTHIIRLQVTEDDVLAVQVFEGIGNLKATVQSLGQKAVPSLAPPIKYQPAVLAPGQLGLLFPLFNALRQAFTESIQYEKVISLDAGAKGIAVAMRHAAQLDNVGMFQTSQEACLNNQVGGTHLVCVVIFHDVRPQPFDGVSGRAGLVATLGIPDAVPGKELSCLGVV